MQPIIYKIQYIANVLRQYKEIREFHICIIANNGRLYHTFRSDTGEWLYPFGDVLERLQQHINLGPNSAVGCSSERFVQNSNYYSKLHICMTDNDGNLFHTYRVTTDKNGLGEWPWEFGDVQNAIGRNRQTLQVAPKRS